MELFDPDQGPNTCEQFWSVWRLTQEIISPGFDAFDPFHVRVRSGEHDHRQKHRCGILADLLTNFMARHLRHHHVKYHEVWLLAFDLSKRLRARTRSEEHTSELQSRGHLVCR